MITDNRAVVLIVEDEPVVRMMAIEIAEDAGFRVLEADNAADAISILEQHPEISVIFTDVEMPGSLNGIKLAAYVRDRWPPVRIIITSGRMAAADINLPAGSLFLAKPYKPADLAGQLTEAAA